ncbi:MAG: RDD family protein [Proteobacteria bacterium]|nr:RDD family protein [Pseudomonadota bacterium]
MNCPKCGYVSFDHLDECKNCGQDLLEHKARLGIKSFKKNEASELPLVLENPQELLPPRHNETAIETESTGTETESDEGPEIETGISSIEDDDEMDVPDPEEDPFFPDDLPVDTSDDTLSAKLDYIFEDKEEGAAIGDSLQMPLVFTERSKNPIIEETLSGKTGQEGIVPLVSKTVFLKRGLAFGLDCAILLGTLCLFLYLGLFILKSKALISTAALTMGIITTKLLVPIIFLSLVVSAAYFSFFHGTTGQTPGKMLFDLKVVGQDNGAVGMDKAFLRWFGYIVSALPLMGGFLMALKDKNGQALHDRIAGTYVVVARPQTVIEEEANSLSSEKGKN